MMWPTLLIVLTYTVHHRFSQKKEAEVNSAGDTMSMPAGFGISGF